MSIEAMKQALKALDDRSSLMQWQAARESLRQAIEEAEKQEPVGEVWEYEEGELNGWRIPKVRYFSKSPAEIPKIGDKFYTHPPKREAEKQDLCKDGSCDCCWTHLDEQPKRKWIGLTEEDVEKSAEQSGMFVDKYGLAKDAQNGLEDGVDIFSFASSIEAKLRRKNGL